MKDPLQLINTKTIEWLRGLAERGGRGVVDNIDARSLGRIADGLEALLDQRKDLIAIADGINGWQHIYHAPNDGTRVLVYREGAEAHRLFGVDYRNPAEYDGAWHHSRPAEQPTYWQELRPPIKAAPMVKRTVT
jgi:hypothetical protein